MEVNFLTFFRRLFCWLWRWIMSWKRQHARLWMQSWKIWQQPRHSTRMFRQLRCEMSWTKIQRRWMGGKLPGRTSLYMCH